MFTHRPLATALAVTMLTACGSVSRSGSDGPSDNHSGPPSGSATATSSTTSTPLTIYYIAIGDAGRSGPAVGCGDSAVATFTGAVRHSDAVAPTVQALLANHQHYLGASGLDNALWQSRLTYQSHTMRGTTVLLHLSGSFRLGGVCDIPRVKAQLEYTAMTAARASSAIVYIGSRTIDQVLSQK